jgi:molybdate transport system substrate-binding protein
MAGRTGSDRSRAVLGRPFTVSHFPKRLAAALTLVLLGACSGSASNQLVVSAAASLTDAFGEIEIAFEAANPDIDVIVNTAGSPTLREQIIEGAPIDVFASANISVMDEVVAAGLTRQPPAVFARNALQVAVPLGNPAGVIGLADFGDADLLIGLCADPVPCGMLANQVLAEAGIVPEPDTREPDVRSLLTKVEAGELDAALVYATDVVGSDEVEGIDTPIATADYAIAVLADSQQASSAQAFVDFVMSPTGQQLLIDHGFVTP